MTTTSEDPVTDDKNTKLATNFTHIPSKYNQWCIRCWQGLWIKLHLRAFCQCFGQYGSRGLLLKPKVVVQTNLKGHLNSILFLRIFLPWVLDSSHSLFLIWVAYCWAWTSLGRRYNLHYELWLCIIKSCSGCKATFSLIASFGIIGYYSLNQFLSNYLLSSLTQILSSGKTMIQNSQR